MQSIIVDGSNLTIEDVFLVAQKNLPINFPEDENFYHKIKQSREHLENFITHGYPIYGVTTGFGDSCDNQINYTKSEELQKSLINFHGIGVGNLFNQQECKAILLVRLNSNVKGYSAIRLEVVELMKNMINQSIIPIIPELGSVGASGDLTPLSYIGAALMGERKVYYKNEKASSAKALEESGLKPVKLKAKEGLAIMNGTSVMTAIAALYWRHAAKLANISDFITAASLEIIEGKDIPYREKVSQLKNHVGQVASANYIHDIIEKSPRVLNYEDFLNDIGSIDQELFKKHQKKIQDRYSLRCAPQINGVLRDTLNITKIWIESEINSANDNPLVDPDVNQVYNTGNFYGGHICAACDYLRIALANISDLSEKQAELIIDGKYNNLTENLIPQLTNSQEMGLYHGFKAAQISITALCSEIQYLSGPVSIHSRPTESLNQDKVSLGTISARKLRECVDLLYFQYAIHILAICQAVDIIGKDFFSPKTQNIYNKIRTMSKFVSKDRPLDNDTTKVKEYLVECEIF
ncbi:MAG: aromatic amino acid ammonia-lyase [Spirochaetes bacterium]|nr:aromatic amino acid ammonia-lyase [Spirochaetota bacterium]